MPKRTQNSPSPMAPVHRASYSVEDAARALSIGRTLLFRLLKDGTLKCVRIGRRTLIPALEVDALLARLQDPAGRERLVPNCEVADLSGSAGLAE